METETKKVAKSIIPTKMSQGIHKIKRCKIWNHTHKSGHQLYIRLLYTQNVIYELNNNQKETYDIHKNQKGIQECLRKPSKRKRTRPRTTKTTTKQLTKWQ